MRGPRSSNPEAGEAPIAGPRSTRNSSLVRAYRLRRPRAPSCSRLAPLRALRDPHRPVEIIEASIAISANIELLHPRPRRPSARSHPRPVRRQRHLDRDRRDSPSRTSTAGPNSSPAGHHRRRTHANHAHMLTMPTSSTTTPASPPFPPRPLALANRLARRTDQNSGAATAPHLTHNAAHATGHPSTAATRPRPGDSRRSRCSGRAGRRRWTADSRPAAPRNHDHHATSLTDAPRPRPKRDPPPNPVSPRWFEAKHVSPESLPRRRWSPWPRCDEHAPEGPRQGHDSCGPARAGQRRRTTVACHRESGGSHRLRKPPRSSPEAGRATRSRCRSIGGAVTKRSLPQQAFSGSARLPIRHLLWLRHEHLGRDVDFPAARGTRARGGSGARRARVARTRSFPRAKRGRPSWLPDARPDAKAESA